MSSPEPQNKKEERVFELPVAWLLGRQLVATLKQTLLYTAYGPKLEARDWMVAKVFPSDDQAEADAFWKKKGEFWFDYIADSGDGTKATYSIAYLCLSKLNLKDPSSEAAVELPRGEFLFVGGDTTYHLADYATLHNRFHTPFIWAHEDLKALTLVDDVRRPIFGIPGNHDYYDMLDGFRRQFRLPFPSRPDNKDYADGSFGPQLRIPGFERHQEASYVALRLPFEWMMWGLDTEVGKIDERQRDFFQSVNNGKIPDKLIVATCAPTTVFGKFADRDDEKSAKTFFQLGLPRPFLPDEKLEDSEKDLKLKPEQIRLDLSGDVHHYARYWGPEPQPPQNPRPRAKALAISKPNYASVVSGLGGAFHHPSTTYVDEVKEQVLYPPEDVARGVITDQIFSAVEVARGGNVWLIGAILAVALTFAAITSQSSRPAIYNFGPLNWLHITQPMPYESLTHMEKQGQPVKDSVWRKIGIVTEDWSPKLPQKAGCENKPMYLWGDCRIERPSEYMWGMGILLLTILPIGAALVLTSRFYGTSERQQEVKEGAMAPHEEEEKPKEDENQKIVKNVDRTLGVSTFLTILLVVVGVLAVLPYRPFITPFGNSLLVLATLIWAGVAIYLSIRYSDWLFQQAAKRKIRKRDWIITWVLSIAAAASVAIGLWVFGKNSLPAYLVSDIVFVALLLATLIALPLAGVFLGGEHQKGAGKWVGMGLIGLWHWLLQLGVALFLIIKGTWLTVILAVIVFLVFKWIGKQLMRANRRWWLLAAWLEFGAIMLALPPLVYALLMRFSARLPKAFLDAVFCPYAFDDVPKSFAAYEWLVNYGGWWQLFPLFLAALFGAALSCMWLGWYFGVCLGFNGHNNEIGGAARIERFKQFIRFRLTENDLTGYVIAVDDPQEDGRLLKPKLIDVFRLAKKP